MQSYVWYQHYHIYVIFNNFNDIGIAKWREDEDFAEVFVYSGPLSLATLAGTLTSQAWGWLRIAFLVRFHSEIERAAWCFFNVFIKDELSCRRHRFKSNQTTSIGRCSLFTAHSPTAWVAIRIYRPQISSTPSPPSSRFVSSFAFHPIYDLRSFFSSSFAHNSDLVSRSRHFCPSPLRYIRAFLFFFCREKKSPLSYLYRAVIFFCFLPIVQTRGFTRLFLIPTTANFRT